MDNNQLRIKRLFTLITILLVCMLGYVVTKSLLTLKETSRLDVTSFNSGAVITISGASTTAEQIGVGSAHVRVKPGDYYVATVGAGQKAGALIHVAAHTPLTVTLSPETTPTTTPPSVDTINFINTEELLNNGVSSAQLTNIKQLYFDYKNTAKTVTINPGSVLPGLRDPNSINFSLTYSGNIDSTPYRANLIYSGDSTVDLTLFNSSNNTQLFHGALPIGGINGPHD